MERLDRPPRGAAVTAHKHTRHSETKFRLSATAVLPKPDFVKAIRQAGGFFLRLLFWYVLMTLLITLSPVFKDGYAVFFRACARSMFSSFHVAGRTAWLPAIGRDDFDTEVRLRNVRVPNIEVGTHCDSRRLGYAPLSVIVALALATPLPWRRRATALLWSLLAVHLFIALRLEVSLLFAFCGDGPVRLYTPSLFWSGVLRQAYLAFTCSFPLPFIAPTVLWILVTFRRGDLDRLCAPRAGLVNSGGAI